MRVRTHRNADKHAIKHGLCSQAQIDIASVFLVMHMSLAHTHMHWLVHVAGREQDAKQSVDTKKQFDSFHMHNTYHARNSAIKFEPQQNNRRAVSTSTKTIYNARCVHIHINGHALAAHCP